MPLNQTVAYHVWANKVNRIQVAVYPEGLYGFDQEGGEKTVHAVTVGKGFHETVPVQAVPGDGGDVSFMAECAVAGKESADNLLVFFGKKTAGAVNKPTSSGSIP